MRTSPISIDMDFRIIPSTVPLQSPSPDRKSLNFITPTISPNTIDIKKSSTPINTKNYRYERYQRLQRYQKHDRQKQNTGLSHQLERQTQAKYYTQSFHPGHSHFQTNSHISNNNSQNQSMSQGHLQYTTVIKQKDQVIRNLKSVIETMAQNNLYKKINGQQEKQLRNQVKILTIQNQKLVNIIQKMTKKNNQVNSNNNTFNNTNNSPSIFSIDSLSNTNTLQSAKINQQYEAKINQLMRTIKENQHFYQQEAKEIKRFNKSLNTQCKNLQNANKELENQNKKLIKILKQKNQGDKIGNMKLSDSIQTNEPSQAQLTTNKSQQKLTLMKIRQQHSENLKMLKEGLIRQIQQTFDTMKIALQGMNSKVTALAKRLQSLEKMTWARMRKTHTQTQTITVTIKQLQPVAQLQPEGSAQTDRTFKPQKKNNSQIYIEQCPSSSHDKASRDQFSRMEQVASNKNLHNSFQQQLEAVKNQLIDLKIKYKKLREDSSPSVLSYSRSQTNTNRSQQIELANLQQKYRITREQLDLEIQKRNALLQQNMANKNAFEKHIGQIKQATQQQVQMLVKNYQKQLQMLRKQNSLLKKTLQDQQPKTQTQRAQLDVLSSKVQELQQINTRLEETNQKIQQQLLSLQLKLQSEHKKLTIMNQTLEDVRNQSQQHRKKKQQIELELIAKISQLNQINNEALQLRQELKNKKQQIKNINVLSQELQDTCRNGLEVNKKLNSLLEQKQAQLNKIKELCKQIGYDGMLQRIQEMQSLLKLNISRPDQIQSSKELQNQQIYAQNRIQRLKLQAEVQELRNELLKKQQHIIRLQSQVSQLQKLEKLSRTRQQELITLNKQSTNRLNQLQNKLISSEKIKVKQNQKIEKLISEKEDIVKRLDDIKKIEKQRIQNLKTAFYQKDQNQNKERSQQ